MQLPALNEYALKRKHVRVWAPLMPDWGIRRLMLHTLTFDSKIDVGVSKEISIECARQHSGMRAWVHGLF